MLKKKTGKTASISEKPKNFQSQNIFAKSDRGKNFIGHIRLTFDFRPFVLLEKKLFLTIYGFLIFRPSCLIVFILLLIRFFQ